MDEMKGEVLDRFLRGLSMDYVSKVVVRYERCGKIKAKQIATKIVYDYLMKQKKEGRVCTKRS